MVIRFSGVLVGPEPDSAATTTRIQIIIPPDTTRGEGGGSKTAVVRVNRRYLSSDPVEVLFKFAHEHMLTLDDEPSSSSSSSAAPSTSSDSASSSSQQGSSSSSSSYGPSGRPFDLKTCAPPVQSLRSHLGKNTVRT